MGTPFIGELRLVSFPYAPKGWAQCNGQFMPINQNQALFSLLGTMYGGNGQTTFALPDLRDKIPIHVGNGHTQGETAGSNAVTVNIQQLPTHLHALQASSVDGNTPAPSNNVFARTVNNLYGDPASLTPLIAQSVSTVGGSQPHENRQPYLKLLWVIALVGIFPSRN